MPSEIQDRPTTVTTEDIEYLRHGDRAMILRLFRPAGDSPFPFVVDLHGGAWTKGDLTECADRSGHFAQLGIAAAALDFRHAKDGYPSSLQDINYAVRWLKSHASELGLDADRVGIAGQSSGGHLAMLAAMRPRDPRYAKIPLEGGSADATVRCVGMTWPVINPLSRYRHALRRRSSDDPPAWTADIPERQDTYWATEDAMSEGNPMLALERGEAVETPPAMWVQGQPDEIHDYRDPEADTDLNEPERFARNYRNDGGEIDIVYIDQTKRDTATAYEPLGAFFVKHLAG